MPSEIVVQEAGYIADSEYTTKPRRQSGRKSLGKSSAAIDQPPPPPEAAEKKKPPLAIITKPPRDKTADPALCLDTIDEMHQRWKAMEVCISIAYFSAYIRIF